MDLKYDSIKILLVLNDNQIFEIKHTICYHAVII